MTLQTAVSVFKINPYRLKRRKETKYQVCSRVPCVNLHLHHAWHWIFQSCSWSSCLKFLLCPSFLSFLNERNELVFSYYYLLHPFYLKLSNGRAFLVLVGLNIWVKEQLRSFKSDALLCWAQIRLIICAHILGSDCVSTISSRILVRLWSLFWN